MPRNARKKPAVSIDPTKLAIAAKPSKMGAYVSKLSQAQTHVHQHPQAESVREDVYDGHRIVVRTVYEVTVDGKTVNLPMGVDNDGQLHCHSLPNYQFASAIDLIKTIIDSFPDDFPMPKSRGGRKTKKKTSASKANSASPRRKKGSA